MIESRFSVWSEIFTVPDNSLFKEGSIDPMGLQAVWSKFGQDIFKNRLNTISTDIRSYTINLFHHIVLRKLYANHHDSIQEALRKFKSYQRDYDLKSGILLFLEDLLVGILVTNKKNPKVGLSGLLGTYKAEVALQTDYILKADREKGGFLTRQMALGVSGRYKGPFISMGFFKSEFQYEEKIWPEIEAIFKQWEPAEVLASKLATVILERIKSCTGDYLASSLSDYLRDKDLVNGFIKCFGTRAMPASMKIFWEKKLGLTQGAAMALYSQMAEREKTPKDYYALAERNEHDAEEKNKLYQINTLEPFLSVCTQVFYLTTQKAVKQVEDIVADVSKLGSIETDSIKELNHFDGRLSLLVKAVDEAGNNPIKLVYNIVDYHNKVMEQKGAAPWVRILDGGKLERLFYLDPEFSTDEFVKNRPWYNNYYIYTLKSIYAGLNPEIN